MSDDTHVDYVRAIPEPLPDIPFWEFISANPDVKVCIPYYECFPDTNPENLIAFTFPYVCYAEEYFCMIAVDKTTGIFLSSYWAPGVGTKGTVAWVGNDFFVAVDKLYKAIFEEGSAK